MKVMGLTAYGGPDALKAADQPVPKPGPGEVLTRVLASSVNPIDTQARRGQFPDWFPLPCVLGLDAAGVVEAVGAEVEHLEPGDEVYYMAPIGPDGTYAEYHAAAAERISLKPASLDMVQAAALPLVGQTAWDALVVKAEVASGDRALILAGAGGVGHVAIQLCKARGAVVYASCSAANLDFVRAMGAVRAIDRNGEDVSEVIGELTGGQGVDVILESMGGDHLERALDLLAEGGRLASINVEEKPQSLLQAFLKFASLHLVLVRPHREKLAGLTELVEAGELRPHIAQVFPLSEVGAAHARLEAGGVCGKLVLDHTL